ncbi:unnamed protein product, partial [Prunus brigantina]
VLPSILLYFLLNAGLKWYFCIIFNLCTYFLPLLSPASIPLLHSCFLVRKKYAALLLSFFNHSFITY